MKRCSKCGIEKDISEFSKHKRSKDGLKPRCKECIKKHYEQNKDEILKKKKEYYEQNKDIVNERKKVYREQNIDKITKHKKEYYEQNKEQIIEKSKEYYEQIPKFTDLKDLLTVNEKPISDEDGLLKVSCTYCDRYFYPRTGDILRRIRCLSGEFGGESRLFCSDNCKKSCPIFGQKKYPKGYKPSTSREVQPELRKMRLKRDNYECQKCGISIEDSELHCHHYTGTVQNPIESADVDNTVTVCKKCHKWVHTQEGCRYFELRCGK